MTAETFYGALQERFSEVLAVEGLSGEKVSVTCRALSPEEAIGRPKRRDFPILAGKDVMIQAQFRDAKGQAFTDAPSDFEGTLDEVVAMDIVHDSHSRSLFIAVLNAVMGYLGRCCGTVHCRTEGPELCAGDMKAYLLAHYPKDVRIALIGYQPALLEMLHSSGFSVRVLDLNPANIGQVRCGVTVEDGKKDYDEVVHHFAELVLCTGSTVCNGTIVDYLELEKEVLFFGTTISGTAPLMGLKRVCFAQNYS